VFAEKLSQVYRGFPARYVVEPSIRALVPAPLGQAGIHHLAITTVPRYLRIQIGIQRMPLDFIDWLCLPEQKLLEFTRGRIFTDPPGEINRLRQALAYFPDDIWRAKMGYAWGSANELLDIVPLNVRRGDQLMARINLNRLIERVMRIVFLLNRRYCPGTPKWQAREFTSLPRLAQEAGLLMDACLTIDDLAQAPALLEELFQLLVSEHNCQALTHQVSLKAPGFGRGLIAFSLDDVVEALQASLPPHLAGLEIQGGLDQWITNPDILIWSEQTAKFKGVYRKKSSLKREGIGDLII